MSDYYPDMYCVIKLTNKETGETHYRVFATFYGGYLSGDTWKLNSGIESVKRVSEDEIEFVGSSGSTYRCHESQYGTGGWTGGVLQQIIEKQKDFIDIEILESRDWVQFFS